MNITRSPYLGAPNILAYPDRKVREVKLDFSVADTYKAGTPINAAGKMANDATCIGILLQDYHKSVGTGSGQVVISGHIQQDVAAEWSGVTISAEAKAALIDITFTGDGGRMGGGGATSWDDLQGKPFGEETVCVEILPEAERSFFEAGGKYAYESGGTLGLTIGETYTVRWDGVEYECVCGELFPGSNLPFIGNAASMNGESEDTGEPFMLAENAKANGHSIVASAGTEHTVGVAHYAQIVKRIDQKFLQETVVVELTDTDGTWTSNLYAGDLRVLYDNGAKLVARDASFYFPLVNVVKKYSDTYFFTFGGVDCFSGATPAYKAWAIKNATVTHYHIDLGSLVTA